MSFGGCLTRTGVSDSPPRSLGCETGESGLDAVLQPHVIFEKTSLWV